MRCVTLIALAIAFGPSAQGQASRALRAVGPENKHLYDIYREMLESKTPGALFQQSMDETICLEKWYGSARSEQLARAAHDKAIADGGGAAAEEALNARLGGSMIEARDCTRPKPE